MFSGPVSKIANLWKRNVQWNKIRKKKLRKKCVSYAVLKCKKISNRNRPMIISKGKFNFLFYHFHFN